MLDVLVQERCNAEAAERFLGHLLERAENAPERIITNGLASYAAAKQRIPALHVVSHLRQRRMQLFKSPAQAQRFLTAFSRTCNLFRIRRHLLTADNYRARMRDCFQIWREATRVVA